MARSKTRTSIDLPARTRDRVCELLQARLSDTVDLHWQIKQAHWTVRGPSFIALHELFDRIAGEALVYADDIAERIQALGGLAAGTITVAAKASSLRPYPVNAVEQGEHVEAVSRVLAAYGELVRKAIDQCEKLEDAGTADLFTQISRGVDKSLWFVEAHQG